MKFAVTGESIVQRTDVQLFFFANAFISIGCIKPCTFTYYLTIIHKWTCWFHNLWVCYVLWVDQLIISVDCEHVLSSFKRHLKSSWPGYLGAWKTLGVWAWSTCSDIFRWWLLWTHQLVGYIFIWSFNLCGRLDSPLFLESCLFTVVIMFPSPSKIMDFMMNDDGVQAAWASLFQQTTAKQPAAVPSVCHWHTTEPRGMTRYSNTNKTDCLSNSCVYGIFYPAYVVISFH